MLRNPDTHLTQRLHRFFATSLFCHDLLYVTAGKVHTPPSCKVSLEAVEGTNRRIQSVLFLNRKCIFKTLSTWLMDVNKLDFTPFTTEKPKIHWICCRCFVGWYELQHYRSSAVQLGAFLWACPFKIMLQ